MRGLARTGVYMKEAAYIRLINTKKVLLFSFSCLGILKLTPKVLTQIMA
jgi:hypothetical protein